MNKPEHSDTSFNVSVEPPDIVMIF